LDFDHAVSPCGFAQAAARKRARAPRKRIPIRFVDSQRRESMRSNSGRGKSQNNRGNPTLEEHERERGRSGEAITGEKKVDAEPSREKARSGHIDH
jgi:hypothetical protein